jgi:probable lipoprotein (TIGR04455 family)
VVDDFGTATLPGDLCSDGVQGILHLAPVAALEGDGAQVQVEARLVRCTDQVEIWSAAAAGSWSSKDDDLDGVRAYWVRELGEEVGPWVVPTFRLVTATLETLPEPALPNEAWVREKIELGD